MTTTYVFTSPTFPDESGNLMSWPIPGRRVLIYWQVMSAYGDHTADVTPTCTITKPDGTQVQATLTDEFFPNRAFEYYPDIAGLDALYNGIVSYEGGLVLGNGQVLEPASEVFDFHVRECIGDVGTITESCWDGSVIVTRACVDGYLVDTGVTCPLVCEEGNLRGEIPCPDGSTIYSEVCQDNAWVPADQICPEQPPFPWWLLLLLASAVTGMYIMLDEQKKKKKR